MKTRLVLALLLLALGTGSLSAQAPETVGRSAVDLKQAVRLFDKAVAEDELRGAVLLVMHKGHVVLHQAVGWRNYERQQPMQKDTLFHVASNTKAVTAAAALMLVEEGKLELDAPVSRYLPAFDNDKCRAIKVRHLLNHTSGFRITEIFLKPLLEKSPEHPDGPSLRAEAERFAAIGPREPPGTTYAYSNPGYNTLGAVIEAAAGQPFEQIVTTRIYRPLGMVDAFHQDRPEWVERRACIYTKNDGTWKRTYQPGDPPRYPFVRASGGLITTAADYARFLQMFLNGGSYNGRRLLRPETVRLATTPQTPTKPATSYGFGWQVAADGTYSHGGSDGTYAWVDSRHAIIGVLFTQSPGGRIPRDLFVQAVRRALGVGPTLPADLGPIAGALVIVGGGALPDAVRTRFLELAGGKDARLVIIPTASATADGPDGTRALELWKKQPVAEAVLLHTRKQADANDPAFVEPLRTATGVWFEGGDQTRLTAAYRGTAVERELRGVLARGGVLGGTSAGAAVMSATMIASGNPRANVEAGLGFLPGVIVDQHFLRRNRVNRLFGVVAQHPDQVGLGIDEQTAVVVKGRGLTVVGNSYVLVCLAASAQRPASVQVLKAGERADLIALRRSALARTQPPFPPARPAPPKVAHGTLIIGGGGGLPATVVKRFIDLAGGPEAPIVVVPTAMDDPLPATPSEVRMLKQAGAKNVKVLHTRDRAAADSAAFVAPLREAKGLWFSGGRQWRFVDAYAGTATERAFHEVLTRGGVIGGSSAGASIQSEYMPRGDPLGNLRIMAEGYERGFGFLKGVAIDQHFFARRRQKDMTELISTYPQLLGIGIDEGTVLIVQGSIMEVVGKSKVAVYDSRKPSPAADKDYEELPAGARYDLEKRQRLESP